MKILKPILGLVLLSLITSSCYYDTFPENQLPIPDEVSYSEDIQPLWNQDCVSCHQGNIPPNLSADVSYNSLITGGYVIEFNASESVLYHSLLGIEGVSLMPPSSRWPDDQIQLVEKWIDDGAENN